MSITIRGICEKMCEEGLPITYRSFWFYVEQGVFRQPDRTERIGKGRAGVYEDDYIDTVREALKCRDKGMKLHDIRERMSEVDDA
jgi:DNA-binding transcriptional MerR regulator